MIDKIIIDGVDVAGCEYYKGKCMEYTHYCQIGCKECTDIGIKLCHYKQTERFKAKITRLEQENKELSFAIEKCLENAGIECDDEEQALRSLSDLGASHYKILLEKEKLKEEKEKYKPFYELGAKCTQLNEVADSLNNLNSKYKSALEEIRELAEKSIKISYNLEVNSMLYDITDKINEVLNDK